MKLHVLSDLHLEQESFTPPETDADVVVLAGDTAPGIGGVEWAKHAFRQDQDVLYLAGNHEYYGHAMPGLLDDLRRAAAEAPNLHVLEDDELTIGEVRFLGATLWTDFDTAGAERRDGTMRFAERVSNDYKLISSSSTGEPLRSSETREAHLRSRAFLTDRLDRPHHGPTIVITHHVPLLRRQTDNLVLQALAGPVASDLSELMGSDRAALWVYGHSHRQADLDVRGTRVLSNPRGYPHAPVAAFDPALVVEI